MPKKKQKKAGMLKRKQKKQVKKGQQRQKQAAASRASGPPSQSKFQKMLVQLPTLAYEEELQPLLFDAEMIRSELDEGLSHLELVAKLATSEFVARLGAALGLVEARSSQYSQTGLLAQVMQVGLEREEMPPAMNPLIVALYLRSKTIALDETPIERDQIVETVNQYFEEYSDVLEQAQMQQELAEDLAQDEEWDDEDPAEAEDAKVDKNFLKAYYQQLESLDSSEATRRRDDVEAFVDDFLPVMLEECTADQVDEFLGKVFIEEHNAMLEDVESMQQTLEHFFQFAIDQEEIPSKEGQAILQLLQDKERYTALLATA